MMNAAAAKTAWIKSRDGIWPMFIKDVIGGQLYVTQYGRGDWRWTHFNGHSGASKKAAGTATTERAAKAAALTS